MFHRLLFAPRSLRLAAGLGLLLLLGACGNPAAATAQASTADSTKPDSITAVEIAVPAPAAGDRHNPDFEKFANHFLNAVYWELNMDSMLFHGAPATAQFIHPQVGFGRYWNEGVYCFLYRDAELGYHEVGLQDHARPHQKHFKFYPNQLPKGEPCDPSPSPDGGYFQAVTKFPDFQDPSRDEDVNRAVKLAAPHDTAPKMRLVILEGGEKIRDFYFVQVDQVWYLALLNACDCSA